MTLSTDIINYMGQLIAAARDDLESADPSDVGLHGVPIKHWREAYLEGIKDMAAGIVIRLPEVERNEVHKAVLEIIETETKKLKTAKATP